MCPARLSDYHDSHVHLREAGADVDGSEEYDGAVLVPGFMAFGVVVESYNVVWCMMNVVRLRGGGRVSV